MGSSFQVSVIIPVYNAKKYLEESVESALNQSFVKEVVLVEDGNHDGTLELCYLIEQKHDKVKVYIHPNNENLGASASRNLGIEKSQSPFIAFLDADDIYLDNRFLLTAQRFADNPGALMIYEPVGVFFTTDKAKEAFCIWKGISWIESDDYITYNESESSGKEFFNNLLRFGGFPHLNGITIAKGAFNMIDQFNPVLRLHQDTDLIIRLAHTEACFPGDLTVIVAKRRFHEENRITRLNFDSRYLQMTELRNWALRNQVGNENLKLIFRKYYVAKIRALFQSNGIFVRIINSLIIRFL